MDTLELDKKLTANQLFKIYRSEGGTLDFKAWLTREKKKGHFSADGELSNEINVELSKLKSTDVKKTVLGFPTETLVMLGAVLVGAIVLSQVLKKKA
jgi:hypothetical protein